MRVSPLSKKLIVSIIGFTIAALVLLEIQKTEEPSGVAGQMMAHTEGSPESLAVQVNSLTNMTHHVTFEPESVISYMGYVRGTGYASYQFYAQKNQKLTANLKANEEKTFELILFGPDIVVLKSGQTYHIVDNGLYELRVVFRNQVEQQQARQAKVNQAQPQPYHLTLEKRS